MTQKFDNYYKNLRDSGINYNGAGFEDYYTRIRDADYKINPFNMKMMNPGNAKKHLPLLLPNGPNPYKKQLKTLKQDSDLAVDEWKSNYINYNTYVMDPKYKTKNIQGKNEMNGNRHSANRLRGKLNKDLQTNDAVLLKQIKTLEKLKKELTGKKITYNKLLHSANASGQLKNDKESLYTESTVRFILQLIGIGIAGGIVYKVSN